MPSLDEQLPWWEGVYHDPFFTGGIAVALMLGTYGLFQLPVSLPLLVAGGCGTALLYGMDRGILRSPEDHINHPRRRQWVRSHYLWIVVEALVFLIVGSVALAHLRPETRVAAGGLALLAALHLLPVERWVEARPSLGVGKPLIVTCAWAIGGALLPVIESRGTVGAEGMALAGYRGLFILPNVLLADWADRRGDVAAGLGSWAQEETALGVRGTATVLLVFAMGGAAFAVWRATPAWPLLVDAIGPLLMLGAVWTLRPAHPGHRLLMDGLVGWPLVTALVAWIWG